MRRAAVRITPSDASDGVSHRARARPRGSVGVARPLRAPPLNETVQLSLSTDALGRDNGTDVESVKRRIANLLSSEPGVGVCDSTPRERVANVVTSLPFFACGADLLRRARAAESRPRDASPSLGTREGIDARAVRRYGLCMFGVGAAACAYHLAPLRRPPLRVALRQADFTSIALASVVASEAYGAALPRWFRRRVPRRAVSVSSPRQRRALRRVRARLPASGAKGCRECRGRMPARGAEKNVARRVPPRARRARAPPSRSLDFSSSPRRRRRTRRSYTPRGTFSAPRRSTREMPSRSTTGRRASDEMEATWDTNTSRVVFPRRERTNIHMYENTSRAPRRLGVRLLLDDYSLRVTAPSAPARASRVSRRRSPPSPSPPRSSSPAFVLSVPLTAGDDA